MKHVAIKSLEYSKNNIEDRIIDIESKWNTEDDGVNNALNQLKEDFIEISKAIKILENNLT